MKNTRRSLLILLLLLAGLAGCSGVEGSGTPATDTRTVSSFSEIEVHGVVRLELVAGKSPTLELTGDDNLLPLVETKVDGARLIVRNTETVRPELPLVVKVTAEDVSKVVAHGAVEVDASGLDNDAFELSLHGAADAKLAGKTKKLSLRVSGAAEIDAKGMSADRAEVNVSGAGDVHVAEPSELDVEISGAGSVSYGGDPKISKSISGAGSLDKR
jgi:hypothetical protein